MATMIPSGGEKDICDAVGSKLFPATVKFEMVWPWVPEAGAIEDMNGGLETLCAAGLFSSTETALAPPAVARSTRPSPSRSAATSADAEPTWSICVWNVRSEEHTSELQSH